MTPAMRAFLAARRLAVVGVSRSEEKYGTKVYRVLTEAGYEVYGVNPNLAELDGRPVYPSLSELPVPVEGVVVVIPPAAAVEVIREAARLSIPRVWLQPGAESPEADQVAQELGIDLVRDACIMLLVKTHRGPVTGRL